MVDKVVLWQVVWLGCIVWLQCLVEGDLLLLIMWIKDGCIIYSGWSCFCVLLQGLKVKQVEWEDVGVYVCKVINGFGSLSVNYIFVVLDDISLGKESLGFDSFFGG